MYTQSTVLDLLWDDNQFIDAYKTKQILKQTLYILRLEGDLKPCLLDGLPSSEGRASAYKAEGRQFNPSGSSLFLMVVFPTVD